MAITWQGVVALATELPQVEESTWWRSPALKVGGKGFARLRDEAEGGLVLQCEMAEKEALLASGDPTFYTTPHYDGYGYILIDLDRIDPAQLRELLDAAWWLAAPAKLRKQRAQSG
ncbi:MmcQ/YjbR family DNA-binding protein [Nocardia sp. NPDC048505]|uniref:MmcQ/YjbR family DNA-binding protein n=1 Tax=unclassified Nocardia TaxID=2637762 RepID=UPI00340174AD